MDRRAALKNLSLGLGATIAGPSLINILASCSSPREGWVPTFFTPNQGEVLTRVVDVIFPVSEIPGGLDVNVPELIDVMYRDVESVDNQKTYQKGMDLFIEEFEGEMSKSIDKASTEDVAVLFGTYFNLDADGQAKAKSLRYADPKDLNEADTKKHYIYNFLMSTRDYTIFGYYSSEKVGKEVLNYDPIPGGFDPCVPLDELGGKSWSLS
jgi:hypothetical protein